MVNTARMRWRCRRGMRELDAAFAAFLEHDFASLDEADLKRFEALLDLPDPVLYAYLVGHDSPSDPALVRLIDRIRRSIAAQG